MPSAAGGVSAAVEYDVQSDAAAVPALDMGIPRVAPAMHLGTGGKISEEAQRHHVYFTRKHVSSYQCEVHPCHSLSLGRS